MKIIMFHFCFKEVDSTVWSFWMYDVDHVVCGAVKLYCMRPVQRVVSVVSYLN